ncbi:DUF1295 domain-containing protein [Solicola gregarius]|uniref:DUF1295 domain-containing protein n=1 Tax=Solicola gregarius TaxID=2908642 RepID=A0AA46TGA7_9ACTN|nr:DUF1295 domain-containing protein [Solicola gregarius]UYM04610.1 DUF1295 domain-containing protein [Solicola gregarius]
MRDAGVVAATLIGSAAVIAAAMVFVLWRMHRTRRVTVIDTVWGAGFAAVAVTGLAITWNGDDNALRALLAVLPGVWGLRLAVHLGLRNRGSDEDRRYADLFERHGGATVRTAAVWVCLPQGVGMWVVALPIMLAQASTAQAGWWLVPGMALWLLGMYFETVGDAQLARFRADPANRGRVLDTGLWRYTRHPNYFGDACVWWGIYLCACSAPIAALAFLSPVAMTWLLARGTGKPLMERHLDDRPEYAAYVRRTSGFVPLPPRD